MEPIWLDHYPPGIPADISNEAAKYDSLMAMFEESCSRHGQNVAYISMGVKLTYAELDERSRHFAAWLQAHGIKKGDRVALMMPNLLQYPVCLFGVLRMGAVVVNTNPLYTPSELEHQLQDSGAETIIIAENFAHTLQKALPNTSIKTIIKTSVGDMLGTVRGAITNLVVRHVKKLIPTYSLTHTLNLKQVLKEGSRSHYTRPELTQKDIALLQYTGGTTGVAKGAMLTHGNMVANVCQAEAWVDPYLNGSRELIVTALPLYHIFALTANCLTFVKLGASNLLIINPRDIPDFIKSLSRHKFTAITGVNTLFNALLNHPDFAKLNFSSLKLALGGGMAVQEVIAQRWLKVTGKPIAQAYGLTETSPAVTINPLDKTEFNGSIGLPVSSTEISIRNEAGQDLPQGESGEICVRGPQVTPGYWNRPDETRKSFHPDGFLMTGDIGYVDEQGYVYILDRKKDMILVSGFNVYPNEVEAVAMEHPDVREAAAIGVSDEHSGEVVKLFVIRKNNTVTEEELIKFCRNKLTGYKAPKFVQFCKDLPRTNVGKILRRELKEGAQNKAQEG
ncbi:AMP-binding protein [Pollutimonas harenae]|uniref:Long-chain-fatty-acid--CoA ligase n=1 Tax=Pollutimonas harenae TaxID=657015 RepID=A0A853GZ11_9BURK|nr:AMP-binding protein [Pollutimonas harenae]NYT84649.1 AMP-binding protein [Pollutimonas harenae]TEA72947.1 long-chain-fatty-acid--CoA ligase [Pollutimonas harenae]